MYHMVLPRSYNLYHKAIVESGGLQTISLERGEKMADAIQSTLLCDDTDPKSVVACMRSISWELVMLALVGTEMFTLTPVIDGYEIVKHPFDSWRLGEFNNVPLLAGNVLNEGTVFLSFYSTLSEKEYVSWVYKKFQNDTVSEAIIKEYPCSLYNPSDCFYAQAEVLGDYLLACPTKYVTDVVSKVQPDTYAYVFMHQPEYTSILPKLGVFHSSELAFVFNTLDTLVYTTTDEHSLAESMNAFWGQFAKSSSPNKDNQISWPKYVDASGTSRIGLQVKQNTNITNWKKRECAFWETMYPYIDITGI